jgi:hypothetical protein
VPLPDAQENPAEKLDRLRMRDADDTGNLRQTAPGPQRGNEPSGPQDTEETCGIIGSAGSEGT